VPQDFEPGSPFALLSGGETAVWYAYMKVYLRLEYELNRQLRTDSGISLADYHVLVALTSESGGRMRVTDLAIRIGWERSRLSHHLKRMRQRGLVETDASAEDRRAVEVVLSEAGWETLRRTTSSSCARPSWTRSSPASWRGWRPRSSGSTTRSSSTAACPGPRTTPDPVA
jgi:DNA-binding MarR family transcriptional regulator